MDNTYRHCGGWTTARVEDGTMTQQEAFHEWYKKILQERSHLPPAIAEVETQPAAPAAKSTLLKGSIPDAAGATAVEVDGRAEFLDADDGEG